MAGDADGVGTPASRLTSLARRVGVRAGRVATVSVVLAVLAGWYGLSAADELTVDGFQVTSERDR